MTLRSWSNPLKHPLITKLFALTLVIVLLMFGLSMIENVVRDRQYYRSETERSVVQSLAGSQTLIGPIIHSACVESWDVVTGTGKDGMPRRTYLYHVSDNADTMRDYGAQCVVWQTAINPVVALELLANGTWSGAGVLGPEAFDAVPFLDLLAAPKPQGYGSPWGLEDR